MFSKVKKKLQKNKPHDLPETVFVGHYPSWNEDGLMIKRDATIIHKNVEVEYYGVYRLEQVFKIARTIESAPVPKE